jgi:hypothetical protein
MSRSVTDIDATELIGRAVRNARARDRRKGQKHPRWVAVMDAFALGSGFAHELCRVHGLDPDELVRR